MRTHSNESGFSLPELLIAMTIMLLISGAAVTALMKMTSTQATIWNRTQMHSGIRGATEVLQQEVGQAGRIALPSVRASIAADVTTGAACVAPTGTTPPAGWFYQRLWRIDDSTTDATLPVDLKRITVTATIARGFGGAMKASSTLVVLKANPF